PDPLMPEPGPPGTAVCPPGVVLVVPVPVLASPVRSRSLSRSRSRSAVLAPADELEAPGAGLVTGVDPCALELSGLAPPVSTLRPSWVDSGLRSLLAPYEPPAAKPSALKETAATPHTNIGMNFLRI